MAQTASVAAAARGTVTGRKVLACLVAFFAVVAGVNAVMIHFAVSTFGGVETGSAYKAGAAYPREIAAAAAQAARGWQVEAELRRTEGGYERVRLLVRDAAGTALGGLAAVARLNHPADRRLDIVIPLTEIAPGRYDGRTDAEAGQRDLVVELSRGDETVWRSRSRVTVR